MKLKIRSINEIGDASKEFVMLVALEDCDLDHYAIADTTYTEDNTISNKLPHFFWFPPKQVLEGELVVLRTGVGNNRTLNNSVGQKVHRFFWGLKSSVWNDDGDAAVLFEIKTWKTTRA